MSTTFVTASVCLLDGRRVATVRKAGTHRFMLPGGKLEPQETPLACAVREAHEEVGAALDPADLAVLGHWVADAANEPGALVESTVHVCRAPAGLTPLAEIVELRWLAFDEPLPDDLGPLLSECVVPALRRHGRAERP